MEKIKTYSERRSEYFGATTGEEQDIKHELLFDIEEKINEIVEWINNQKE